MPRFLTAGEFAENKISNNARILYYILNVSLTNRSFGSVAQSNLTPEQAEMYAVYMETKGNKPELFADNVYINRGEYTDYDIPPDALNDVKFAAMIRKAEKYLGYPYVWGGSSPSTSFDCSMRT